MTMTFIPAPGQPSMLQRNLDPFGAPLPSRNASAPETNTPLGPLHHLPITSNTGIIDIRSSGACPLGNLDSSILDGLSQPHGHKTLPPLLLWGEKGQKLYDDVLATPQYYPYRIENKLLQERMDEITSTIACSSPNLLVELGAGNMSKTAQFLTSLDKHLSAPLAYYALDVDRAQLERSLEQLEEKTNLRWIKLRALFGTYEDGARWLATPEIAPFRRTLVWLGTSIANYDQHKASQVLTSFSGDPETGTPQNLAGFLLLIDGCQDAARIKLAYDVPGGASRRWMMQAIEAARDCLRGGDDEDEVNRLLADENWRFEGEWYAALQRYETYLVPTRPLVGTIRGRPIHLREGERVRLVGSGKWARDTVSSVALKPGLEVRKAWYNVEFNYGAYWLQPTIKRHDSGIDMVELSAEPGTERLIITVD